MNEAVVNKGRVSLQNYFSYCRLDDVNTLSLWPPCNQIDFAIHSVQKLLFFGVWDEGQGPVIIIFSVIGLA